MPTMSTWSSCQILWGGIIAPTLQMKRQRLRKVKPFADSKSWDGRADLNSGPSLRAEALSTTICCPKDDDIIRAITVMLMTVIINAGSLSVWENEERRKSEEVQEHTVRAWGRAGLASESTHSAVLGGGGRYPVSLSQPPAHRTVCSEPFSLAPSSTSERLFLRKREQWKDLG